MSEIAEFRRLVLAQPETTEGTHFRMPAFAVRGKNFASIDRDGEHVMLSLAESEAPAAAAADPGVVEEVRRFDKPIGIRVDIARISTGRLAELVEIAWRHKAPKRLSAERRDLS